MTGNATWYGCTPVCRCCGTVGIFLKDDDGTVHRFRMTPEDALKLSEAIADVLGSQWPRAGLCRQCGIQSSRSVGNPHIEGSPQEGQSA